MIACQTQHVSSEIVPLPSQPHRRRGRADHARLGLPLTASAFALIAGMSAASAQTIGPDTASATQAQGAAPVSTSATAQATVPAEADLNEIVVTGSRIAHTSFDAPSPITSFNAADIQASGRTNLTDYLQRVPALIGSSDSFENSGTANADVAGLNLLDLRHLGTQRTLVLINGRRSVASDPGTAAVDINTIPTDLVERVDVLTGGASAVYGADGVSGVVNFILKKDFDGVSAHFQSGISQYGDGANRLGSFAIGKNFAEGRGNITLSYEYNADNRVSSLDRRRNQYGRQYLFLQNPADVPNASGADNPNLPDNVPLTSVTYADTSYLGAVSLPDDPYTPIFTGSGVPYDRGDILANSGGYAIGGSNTPVADYGNGDLRPSIKRNNVNLLAHYDFSDAFKLSFEGKYVRTHTYTVGQPNFDYYTALTLDNPYIPANIVAAANAAADAIGVPADDAADRAIYVTRDNLDFPYNASDVTRQTYRGVIDATGRISDHASYDLYYEYGQTRSRIVTLNQRYADRWYASTDVVTNPLTGQPTCRSNIDPAAAPYAVTFTPGAGSGCMPINVLAQGQNPAALDWLFTNDVTHSKITQQVINGSITGDFGQFFELPGGPVKFSIGGEYRKETSNEVPGEDVQNGLLYQYSQIAPVYGKFHVGEFFSELDAPILKNKPWAETLSVGAAFRWSDYSTTGKSTTWQFNGVYAPVKDISFRGSYSKAVRAPNIGELFSPTSQGYFQLSDPCDISQLNNGTANRRANCAAILSGLSVDPATFSPLSDPQSSVTQLGTSSGNTSLKQETAHTWTAGVVLRPRLVPGLTASFDWYHIKIKDAINTPTAQQVAELCVDSPSVDNQYCAQLNRDPTTGYLVGDDVINVYPENVAGFKISGLDINIDYNLRTDNLGTFNFRFVGGYLHQLSYTYAVGAPAENELNYSNGGAPYPKYNANFTTTWTKGPLSLTYNLGWFGHTRRFERKTTDAKPDYVASDYLFIKAYWQHDIEASMDINKRMSFYLGVNNLTNEQPDFASVDYPVSGVGRYFFAGVRVNTGHIF
jgi:outer membrane receptor protein involved in Fe transport